MGIFNDFKKTVTFDSNPFLRRYNQLIASRVCRELLQAKMKKVETIFTPTGNPATP